MNYPFVPSGTKPATVPAAPKKKKKSPLPSLREWQRINFEYMALTTLRDKNRHPDVIGKLQEKIDALDEQRKPQRRTTTPFITYGMQSVVFFLEHPQYIPIMKNEILVRGLARQAAKARGENILNDDLENSVLAAHCQERSNLIFSKGNSPVGDNTWNHHYLHVRNNFIETMGRAARAAEYALGLESTLEEQRRRFFVEISNPVPPPKPAAPQPQGPKPPIPTSEAPTPKPVNHWDEPRPSEEKVNEILNNHCDDNVPGMEDKPDLGPTQTDPKPVRIAKQSAYVQTDFLTILDRQKN